MAFGGWPVEAIEFFEGLEADNSKAYWTDHKPIYDRCVKAPMDELLAELAPVFGPGKVFRPYRDTRFSKGKEPYKTTIAARVASAGYVQLSSGGLGAGSGTWHMAPDQLQRYRAAVADDRSGQALEDLLAELDRGGISTASHEELRTAPRGYPKDHPRIGLLRRKGLACWQDWPVGAWLGTKKAKDRIVSVLTAAAPLNAWLADHVGDSELEGWGR
jgi:uncharacterized protein (TIGR02453 family)